LTAAALDGTGRAQVGMEGWCRSNKRMGQDDVVPRDFPGTISATIIYRWWLIVTNLVLFCFDTRIILRAQNLV
jgi:hypothetical protein